MKEEKQILISPREFGKTNKALMEFLIAGKQGKSVVFATPQGNFLSPKAVENLISSERKQACQDMIELMEKKKDAGCNHDFDSDNDPCDKMVEAAKEYLKTL